MAPNTSMIGRGQHPAHARPHAVGAVVADPAAGAEIDRWLRARVVPSSGVELGRDELAMRARRLLARRITFVGHPSFDDPGVFARILGPMPGPGAGSGEPRLLTREQEAHLFRKMNFLKSVAARSRGAIDPDTAGAAEIDRVEVLLGEAGAILDRIIGSNLGLVVSVARKYARPGHDFHDRVADGNFSLLRAAERFDFARGFRFSTYATWAIVHDYARSFRKEEARHALFVPGRPEFFQSVVDRRDTGPTVAHRERPEEVVRSLLDHLDDREQTIIAGHFGLTDRRRTLAQLGRELGISSERVRQIESRALRKLSEADEGRRLSWAD